MALHWRHNDYDDVSNHQPCGCLLKRLFRRRSKKTSKLRVTGPCVGNSPRPVNSPHKGPVTRKMFPFDDVIMGKYPIIAWDFVYLHDGPWLSPRYRREWIHVIASQLSRYWDFISNRLWLHQQKEDRASETRGRCKKIVVFIVFHEFVLSCKQWNNICTLVTNGFCAHSSVIFVTRVHTLFSIYLIKHRNN